MKTISEIFLSVPERVKVFTNQTSEFIPHLQGYYAWFFPLWFDPKMGIDGFVEFCSSVFMFDPKNQRDPLTLKGIIQANWFSFDVSAKKKPTRPLGPNPKKQISQILEDPKKLAAFQQHLLEASLLMPPLYVGKANDLFSRYEQHVNGTSSYSSNFNQRFSNHMTRLNSPLTVSDLLFACVTTDNDKIWGSEENCEIIEQVLLRIARPPFSIK